MRIVKLKKIDVIKNKLPNKYFVILLQDVFIDISDIVHVGYCFIKTMERVKDKMVSRFYPNSKKNCKIILEPMLE